MSLHDLLDDAADTALVGRRNVDVDAVLARARTHVRAHRARRAAAAFAAAAAVVVLVLGLQFGTGTVRGTPRPAVPASGPAQVPDVVHAPAAWTPSVTVKPIARAVYAVSAFDYADADDVGYEPSDAPAVVSADGGEYRTLPWRTGDHDLTLSRNGARVAWARDAGAGVAGETVVTLDLATAHQSGIPLPSPSGQGATVTSLTFAPDGRGIVAAIRDGVDLPGGERVLFRTLPTGQWQTVCACRGPLGWSTDGTLLVGSRPSAGVVATAATATPPTVATLGGPLRVSIGRDSDATWVDLHAPGAPTSARLVAGTQALRVDGTDAVVRLRAADGQVTATLPALRPAGAPGDEPPAFRGDAVLGTVGDAPVLSRIASTPDGERLASEVQRIDVRAGASPVVRTLTRAEGGQAVVVAAATELLVGPRTVAGAAGPARASDPAWWHYQERRALDGVLGVFTVTWLLWVPALVAFLGWWGRRRHVLVVARGAVGRWTDPLRLPRVGLGGRSGFGGRAGLAGGLPPVGRSEAGLPPLPPSAPSSQRRTRRLRVVRALAGPLIVALLGAGMLAAGTAGQASQRVQSASMRSTAATVVPDSIDVRGTAPALVVGGSGHTTRLSALVRRPYADASRLVGIDADTGLPVSLDDVGPAPTMTFGMSSGQVALSPSGTVVAAIVGNDIVLRLNLTSGALTWLPLTVSVAGDDGLGAGRLSDCLAVTDDGTVALITGRGALWRYTPDDNALELTRFGKVEGVAAQPSGRFLLWRHFGEEGPARLDLIDPAVGAVKAWMTWDEPGNLRPVAAEVPGRGLLVRTADGAVVLHEDDGTPGGKDTILGRMPQVDWFGASGDGRVVTVVAPEAASAQGASVALASWKALTGDGASAPTRATANGGAGQELTRVAVPESGVAFAPAVVAHASRVVLVPGTGDWRDRFRWTAEDPWASLIPPLGGALLLAAFAWLLLAVAPPLRRWLVAVGRRA